MKHHQYNPDFPFVKKPFEFNKHSEKSLLQYCLGGTLYMPATKDVLQKLLMNGFPGLTSMIMCFEDAIAERELPEAEKNIIKLLNSIIQALQNNKVEQSSLPLIFLRVRDSIHFKDFTAKLTLGQLEVLTGFVFPKVDSENLYGFLECLEVLRLRSGSKLYGMPILEGKMIAQNETRAGELAKLRIILSSFKSSILNIRVGANDFSSFFGVRRGINYSIYDISTVRDCLADILNYFSREGEDYIISAPVWEYFLADKKENIDHLLEGDIHKSLLSRNAILNDAVDGLLREIILDKANGFVGKTVIHPSHIKYVNSLQAVTREEYEDALQVLQIDGGVCKGSNNKMNEGNPHKNWARRIVCMADAYGVVENESSYLKLCHS